MLLLAFFRGDPVCSISDANEDGADDLEKVEDGSRGAFVNAAAWVGDGGEASPTACCGLFSPSCREGFGKSAECCRLS